MDTALTLRIAFENNETLEKNEIANLLNNSKLVGKLTTDFIDNPLFAAFRVIGLSEIPHVYTLPYTQKLIDYIGKNIATPQGFSCLGGVSELVPCYNAMLLEAYCRLGLVKSKEAQSALSWIENYQLFERNQTTSWPHKGICKHGGCIGKTPCYIGIGKTVRALITYSECVKRADLITEKLIAQGLDYMLRHKMYKKLSDGTPISPHITDIMFPQNYALSLTDLAYIIGKRHLNTNENCTDVMGLIKEKQAEDGTWKIDYIYSYKGYGAFEGKRKASEWISKLFQIWGLSAF